MKGGRRLTAAEGLLGARDHAVHTLSFHPESHTGVNSTIPTLQMGKLRHLLRKPHRVVVRIIIIITNIIYPELTKCSFCAK